MQWPGLLLQPDQNLRSALCEMDSSAFGPGAGALQQQQQPEELDVSGWWSDSEEGRAGVVRAFDAAFSEHGYAVLTGAQVLQLEVLQRELVKEAAAFFSLPLEDKMRFHHGPYGHPGGGYTPIGLESVAKSIGLTQKDGVESFIFTRHPASFEMPSESDAAAANVPFQVAGTKYWEEICEILKSAHRIAAAALRIEDEEFFNARYFDDHPRAVGSGGNGLTLKISWYPRPAEAAAGGDEEDDSPLLLYGAHTDYQGFTLLKPDPSDWATEEHGGLEVKSKSSDQWVPVSSGAGGLVVNAGDLFSVWSNGRWHSPVHRVRAPTLAALANSHDRCSVIFFTGPQATTLVEPIRREGPEEPLRHEPIEAGKHLLAKILASRKT